jgi:exosortase
MAAASSDNVVIPLIGVELPRVIVPWILIGAATALLLGWTFLRQLPEFWFDDEGYYSHGILIPFMTAAAIYMRRDQLKKARVGSSPMGIVILIVGILLLLASRTIDNVSLAAGAFIITLIGGTYYAFGKEVGRICLGPLLFLIFMMPVLGWLIDITTNPLQRMSTIVGAKMLDIIGYGTEIIDAKPTTIYMNNYDMLVGGPCSGFKLILSLIAFTTFFAMISNLGWKKNIILFVLSIPLAMFINGLRIMLIGIVGETGITNPDNAFIKYLRNFGDEPGLVFHDWSGYIMLVVCFIMLHYIVKILEGKRPDVQPS